MGRSRGSWDGVVEMGLLGMGLLGWGCQNRVSRMGLSGWKCQYRVVRMGFLGWGCWVGLSGRESRNLYNKILKETLPNALAHPSGVIVAKLHILCYKLFPLTRIGFSAISACSQT